MSDDKLTLYRGDSSKIKTFDLNKCYKECLVGRGVYLTDSLPVADSYRTKGTYGIGYTEPLFYGEAKSKGEALEFSKKEYAKRLILKNKPGSKPTDKEIAVMWEKCKYDFIDMLDSKTIRVEVYDYLSKSGSNAVKVKRYKVTTPEENKTGYLTKFVFPKKHLLSNVIDVDSRSPDVGFLEILYENHSRRNLEVTVTTYLTRIGWVTERKLFNDAFKSFNEYKQYAAREGLMKLGINWNYFIPILEEYGILGYRYSGGKHLGGLGNHNAYSIWDDDFVNEHKVERMR